MATGENSANAPVEKRLTGAIDLTLYSKIDEALSGLDTAFHSLVSAGLSRDEEDQLVQPTERAGAAVFAREIGDCATRALQSIQRLKQISINSDGCSASNEVKDQICIRLEAERVKFASKFDTFHKEARLLVQQTEAHFERYSTRPQPPLESLTSSEIVAELRRERSS